MFKINNKISKLFFGVSFFVLFFWLGLGIANAQNQEKYVFVFVREGCTACAREEAFLKTIGDNIKVTLLDIGKKENYDNFLNITDKNKISRVTPITLVGGEVLVGFDSAQITGKKIIDLADADHKNIEFYLKGDSTVEENNDAGVCKLSGEDACAADEVAKDDLEKIKIPIFGIIDTKDFSLASLAIIIGFIDGFNPCAMWVLVAFLIALSQVGSRSRMIAIAGLFIVAESIMYFFILNVWYQTWDFVKLDWIVVPLVGILSIAGGIYFLYKFKKNNGQLICDVTSLEHQRKTTTKIKNIATQPLTIIGAIVIIGLAFSVNIIEFACSVGLPQSFTKILEINDVGFWGRQFYIGMYTLFYMADDFIIFTLAILGYQKFHQFGAKYSNLALLIGGIILIILGALMLAGKNIFVF